MLYIIEIKNNHALLTLNNFVNEHLNLNNKFIITPFLLIIITFICTIKTKNSHNVYIYMIRLAHKY